MILLCGRGCIHQGQDKLHGEGRRVHNAAKGATEGQVLMRCTVCKNEQSVSRGVAEIAATIPSKK